MISPKSFLKNTERKILQRSKKEKKTKVPL